MQLFIASDCQCQGGGFFFYSDQQIKKCITIHIYYCTLMNLQCLQDNCEKKCSHPQIFVKISTFFTGIQYVKIFYGKIVVLWYERVVERDNGQINVFYCTFFWYP
eukprot:TRINITY_DN1885_c0_g7_i1.p9 TRINITY_DN1885_c0_g7~~TRINITY_DN1885_c0_g7_i1.p9  ORF type:complete len:105 (-),score=2.03 TRINITY_DN1885_c0_g7_i1:46-360(-)